MNMTKFSVVAALACTLTACGGGGGASSSPAVTQTASPATTYTGQSGLAAVNASNQKVFITSMKASIVDALDMLSSKGITNILNNYPANIDMPCSTSGTIKMTGNVNEIMAAGKGTLQVVQNRCNDGTSTGNGSTSIKINKLDVTTRSIIDFDVIYLNSTTTYNNGVVLTMSGTRQVIQGSQQSTVISAINYKASNGGETQNNLKFVLNYMGSSSSENAVSGQLCEGSNGCVNITTPLPYLFPAGSNGFVQGQSVLTGAANSKTRLEVVGGLWWMSLDANGDGVYESTTQYVN